MSVLRINVLAGGAALMDSVPLAYLAGQVKGQIPAG